MSTSAIPVKAHTRCGIADACGTTLCNGQPDPGCPCKACDRYYAAQERHADAWERPAYGSGE